MKTIILLVALAFLVSGCITVKGIPTKVKVTKTMEGGQEIDYIEAVD